MSDHGHAHSADGSCPSGHEEDKLVNTEALQANMMGINFVRALMAIVSGIVAGVIGLTGLKGFLLFVSLHLVTSLTLLAKMKFNVAEYMMPTLSPIWFAVDGVSGQGLSFVMFWTLSFAMVHIF